MTNGIGEQLASIAGKPERIIAGYMSGTSMDGIDSVVAKVRGCGLATEVKLLGFSSTPFAPEVRRRLLSLQMPSLFSGAEVAQLSFLLGELFAEALAQLMTELRLPLSSLDLIGHHGVILFHGNSVDLDICEASVIAERLKCPVITDFRARDCAAGGQGAPLSPYVDWILFRHRENNRAVQNIGGIANVCALRAGADLDDLIGFDTGPGNMVVDGLVSIVTQGEHTYDRNGAIAATGRVRGVLLSDMMAHPYIGREPPKCTGREEFGVFFARDVLERARARGIPDEDVVATATRFTVEVIVDSYRRFIEPQMELDEVIVGGGGVHNPVLMSWLRELLAPARVQTHEDYGIPSDAREALSWAVLANETLMGIPTNVCQITGARRRAVLGKVIPA